MTFFSAIQGNTAPVNIMTSNNGGLSDEQIAQMATDKIVAVSENAPDVIRDQANVFKENVKKLLFHYLLLARREERATIVHMIQESGQKELAEYIRRL
tara:strand:- start:1121 stop:1414 length:294 start_codon:yes stop_codon:yes gene_type:complete